jgi:hypothetical protein
VPFPHNFGTVGIWEFSILNMRVMGGAHMPFPHNFGTVVIWEFSILNMRVMGGAQRLVPPH